MTSPPALIMKRQGYEKQRPAVVTKITLNSSSYGAQIQEPVIRVVKWRRAAGRWSRRFPHFQRCLAEYYND
jgi:hypothetical protein